MKQKTKAIFFNEDEKTVRRVFGNGRWERVAELTDLHPVVIGAVNFEENIEAARAAEVAFSTWGIPPGTAPQWDRLTSLKAVFYGAGSVRGFAERCLNRGIRVISSWGANAIPVAEFTLAQILLSCKGYFRNTMDCRSPEKRHAGKTFMGPGNFGERVALLGAGMIGRQLIEYLKLFKLKVLVYDPYLSGAEALRLGVEKVSLEDAFARACVVSNHMPNLPETTGVITGRYFAAMRRDATFINTGRGAQVVEHEMIATLEARPDLTALLDVTEPEPPAKGSKLYTLPNVHLSSHIAGSMNDEVVRMADFAIDEFVRWNSGQPLRYEVTAEIFRHMA